MLVGALGITGDDLGADGRDLRREVLVGHRDGERPAEEDLEVVRELDVELLLDLADNMTGKTICVLSDSCAAPVVSGIQKFRDEFDSYIAGARRPVLAAV